jgi:hypothetical protein
MQLVPKAQLGPVPHWHVALEQLSARLKEHCVQALPPFPQSWVVVPA